MTYIGYHEWKKPAPKKPKVVIGLGLTRTEARSLLRLLRNKPRLGRLAGRIEYALSLY